VDARKQNRRASDREDLIILDVNLPGGEDVGIQMREKLIDEGMDPNRVLLISTQYDDKRTILEKNGMTQKQSGEVMLQKPIDEYQVKSRLVKLGISVSPMKDDEL